MAAVGAGMDGAGGGGMVALDGGVTTGIFDGKVFSGSAGGGGGVATGGGGGGVGITDGGGTAGAAVGVSCEGAGTGVVVAGGKATGFAFTFSAPVAGVSVLAGDVVVAGAVGAGVFGFLGFVVSPPIDKSDGRDSSS